MTTKIKMLATTAMLALALALVPACSGRKTKPNGTSYGEQMGPGEVYGPADDGTPRVPYGPEPMQVHAVTLVFGPGMARGLASVGALRALVEAKIPIAAIYGAEMGSLVAAVYAVDSNINHFEWALLKFKDDVFVRDPGFLKNLFKQPESSDGLEKALAQVFGNKNIADTKIPLRIAIQPVQGGHAIFLQKGKIADALRVSVAAKGFFTPANWDGSSALAVSGVSSVTELCQEARAGGGSPIVLIDTSETASDPSAADLVIRPDLSGIGAGDFQRRTDAAFRGKKAIQDHLAEIRKAVGLPADVDNRS